MTNKQKRKGNQMSLWDNLELLQGWYGRIQWALGISGLLTAGLVVLSLKWNDRISDLQEVEKKKLNERVLKAETSALSAREEAAKAKQQAGSLEPGKQPIRSVSAKVEFVVSGRVEEIKWDVSDDDPMGLVRNLQIGRKNEIGNNLWRFRLVASTHTKGMNDMESHFWIDFHQSRLDRLTNAKDMLAEELQKLDVMLIHAGFLPVNAEILRGTVVVTVNLLQQEYVIPSQKLPLSSLIIAEIVPAKSPAAR